MILFHHRAKTMKPQFAPWLYLLLIMFFAATIEKYPVIGLTGLGVTLIIGGVLLELNSPKVWADSLGWRRKNKNQPWYRKPSEPLYRLHMLVLWPGIIALGIYALYAAYTLA